MFRCVIKCGVWCNLNCPEFSRSLSVSISCEELSYTEDLHLTIDMSVFSTPSSLSRCFSVSQFTFIENRKWNFQINIHNTFHTLCTTFYGYTSRCIPTLYVVCVFSDAIVISTQTHFIGCKYRNSLLLVIFSLTCTNCSGPCVSYPNRIGLHIFSSFQTFRWNCVRNEKNENEKWWWFNENSV